LVILVDQTSKDVPAFDLGGESTGVRGVRGEGHCKIDAPMRALVIVVTHVLEKDTLCMPSADQQETVKTLPSYCPHPALGVCIRPRSSDRGLDDPHALGEEHLVKAGGELRVSVADQEVEPLTLLSEITGQVPSDLGHPRAAWVRAHAEEMDSSAPVTIPPLAGHLE
jgi:hypothetical protein